MENWNKKLLTSIFIIVLLASGIIRFLQTANYQFPFTYDQARDMLDIRIPATFKNLPLVGPTTSINGVLLGPGYYYFNLPAFWLWGGNPQGLVYWNIIWFLLAAVAIFIFFYRSDIQLGLAISTIFLFAPQLFNVSRYFWNAHSMVYISVFFLLALWNYLKNIDYKSSLLLGISVGVGMHFEAAFAIVSLLFSFILVICSRRWKILGWFLIGAVPWFLPQIIFEIAKGFGMTKLLMTEFSNSSGILGNKLSFWETIKSHWQNMMTYMEGQFILSNGLGKIILFLTLILGILEKKYRKHTIILGLFFIFAFLFYSTTYHHELKKWYLESLRLWYSFVVGVGVISGLLMTREYKVLRKIYLIFLIIFITRNIYLTTEDQKKFINNPEFAKDDPKLMTHIIQTVDWVYQKTKDGGFEAYNYVPETYDFPYQYTYWWYGGQKYGYIPSTVSYLPKVPEYVPMQNQFYYESKKSENLIGLIYERKSNYNDWLKNFEDYCVQEKFDFEWQVSAEVRVKCK